MSARPTDAQVLDGYRLIRFLGRGGFGEVWLCRSEAMGDFRALKWIPATNKERLEKEYESLLHYRASAARLRSPHLVPIEHVNRNGDGLYYVMPLADGLAAQEPSDPAWQPLSLAAKIHARAAQPKWFSSREILGLIQPVLLALQTLSDAGLVHRDVKPENILFFNGQPCLGDISLLGADASVITRRGTPGYATPSWYAGGHPDMFGAAATLYTLLTGNAPDKMGRSAFLWPPQGEKSLAEPERAEWKRLHGIIRRATEEKVSERFVDFSTMAGRIADDPPAKRKLPRVLVSALTVAAFAAIAAFAAFRGKNGEVDPPATGGTPGNVPAPEAADPVPQLTAAQRADYLALAGMIQGYIGDGQYANALASVEELLSTYPQARTQPAYSIARAMALKGLGRIDEAKEELKKDIHLSPQITPMAARKNLWEEFGDLPEAEKDLSRIIGKFGPSTFALFLRADVRAALGDYPGVLADRQAAFAIDPEDPEQKRLVETMWEPLETKFPVYADYLKSRGKGGKPGTETANAAPDDSWLLDVFHEITYDIAEPDVPLSENALRARKFLAGKMRETFGTGDYEQCLKLLRRTTESVPVLSGTPNLSLLRALLLQRLDRQEEADEELGKPCHEDTDPRLVEARICLLDALGRRREAETLLSRMIGTPGPADDESEDQRIPLLRLRAGIRAERGDFPGVLADRQAAFAIDPGDPEQKRLVETMWASLETKFPAYADYLKSLPGK